jgi:hypothetical protein
VPTIFAARQFVNHGHVNVNGARQHRFLPLQAGRRDRGAREVQAAGAGARSGRLAERDVPDYIEVDHNKMVAEVRARAGPRRRAVRGADGTEPGRRILLVVRVRGYAPLEDVEKRYEQINAFEKHLTENGTTVLKFMLNLSHEEQGIRLKERLVEAHKLWKFNPADLDDRSRWAEFMQAYELAIRRCSTRHAPWYVIPSDSRTRRNALIARIVRGALENMDLKWKDPGLKPESFDFS